MTYHRQRWQVAVDMVLDGLLAAMMIVLVYLFIHTVYAAMWANLPW